MKTITICKDVTVTYTIGGGFDHWYKKELERQEAERQERKLWELLFSMEGDPELADEYSDLYKELTGIRPRW